MERTLVAGTRVQIDKKWYMIIEDNVNGEPNRFKAQHLKGDDFEAPVKDTGEIFEFRTDSPETMDGLQMINIEEGSEDTD